MDITTDKITIMLQALADKMGTTVEHLWSILIKQAHISAWISIYICICALIAGFCWLKISKIWHNKMDNDNWDKDGGMVITAIHAAYSVIAFIIIAANISSFIKVLYNPEYRALQILFNLLNK